MALTNATQSAATQLGKIATTSASQAIAAHSSNVFVLFFAVIVPTFFLRVVDIISLPFRIPEMQWVVIPLIVTFIAIEIYFFQNVEEEMGWNAALTNGLILLFVALDLTRTIFDNVTPMDVLRLFGHALTTGERLQSFMIILFITLLGVFVALVNFFHLLPKKLSYKIAGHAPINYIAYIAVVLVYGDKYGKPVPLDAYTVFAGTFVFAILVFGIWTIQRPNTKVIQRVRGGD